MTHLRDSERVRGTQPLNSRSAPRRWRNEASVPCANLAPSRSSHGRLLQPQGQVRVSVRKEGVARRPVLERHVSHATQPHSSCAKESAQTSKEACAVQFALLWCRPSKSDSLITYLEPDVEFFARAGRLSPLVLACLQRAPVVQH